VYIIHNRSKFGPWGFRIYIYEIKRMEVFLVVMQSCLTPT